MKQYIFLFFAFAIIVLSSYKSPVKSITNNTDTITISDIDGKALFNANGCVACHNMTVKTVGPSVKEIATSYANKKEALAAFLNGKGKAIIEPDQFPIMSPQLNITKKMSDAERAALVDYMLAAK